MTLYEMNQAGYASISAMTNSEIETAIIKDILEYLNAHPSKYYMLLNNDEHYYTLFVRKSVVCTAKGLADEIIDVVKTLGQLKGIEYNQEQEYVEFWISNSDQTIMFALFDYEKGVIEV